MQGRYGIDHFPGFYWWEHWYASCFPVCCGIGTELCQLDSADLMYYRMFSKNIRKRCEEERMYMDTKREGCPVLQRGQKCDQRFQNTQNLPLSALRDRKSSPEREGKIEITCPSCRSKFIKRT